MKHTKTIAEKPKSDPCATWKKLDLAEGAIMTLKDHVNGAISGSKVRVISSQENGAIFLVEVITGERLGAKFRVKASQLV